MTAISTPTHPYEQNELNTLNFCKCGVAKSLHTTKKTEPKEDFWKVVDPNGEFPAGLFFEYKADAIWFAEECRDSGGEGVYTRKVRMTRGQYENIDEAN